MSELYSFPVPLLGFAAYSGTGKTTLLEQLIPLLTEQRINVALVKHSHHDIEMDKPGKDSYRLRKAGASQVLIGSPNRTIIFKENLQPQEPSLLEHLNCLDLNGLDLVLVEGFRDEKFNKIELYRPSLGKALLHLNDTSIIAIASDAEVATTLPQLNINDVAQIRDFVVESLSLKSKPLQLR